ncbi:MAG TPA: EamA family transporter [Xanthomonadaceae bacterium]|jgi:drug/metabolite transporter (DMT)-like permease|nr:EamA family transporter [Xanthomonadaceae bacterium]
MTTQSAKRPRKTLALAWIALVGIEITTQLSLKRAGHVTGHFDFSAHAFALATSCIWLWVAVCSYCAGFLAWMLILGHSDLSRAFPTSAIVFVAILLVSWLVLHESIGAVQFIGAAVIVAGILQLGRDGSVAPPGIPPPPQSAPAANHSTNITE